MKITGIVLAGGLGRRIGGVDKGMTPFHGKPLVLHVIERLRPQVSELFINANREIPRYAALGYSVLMDDLQEFAGPLAGLHKGMRMASHPYVLTAPCDAPLLPMNLAEHLKQGLLRYKADVAVAATGTQTQPVFCLCRKDLLDHLDTFLQNGGRKFADWYRTLNTVEVDFGESPDAFSNINTAEELKRLEQVQQVSALDKP